jgi:hypothetical protein
MLVSGGEVDSNSVSLRLGFRGESAEALAVLRLTALVRSDPSGGMSIADHGTVLAEARTRPFDVLPQNQYSAVGMLNFLALFLD